MPKYEDYPLADPLTGEEILLVVQDGVTKKIPAADLKGEVIVIPDLSVGDYTIQKPGTYLIGSGVADRTIIFPDPADFIGKYISLIYSFGNIYNDVLIDGAFYKERNILDPARKPFTTLKNNNSAIFQAIDDGTQVNWILLMQDKSEETKPILYFKAEFVQDGGDPPSPGDIKGDIELVGVVKNNVGDFTIEFSESVALNQCYRVVSNSVAFDDPIDIRLSNVTDDPLGDPNKIRVLITDKAGIEIDNNRFVLKIEKYN